jgi:hypothetical protein
MDGLADAATAQPPSKAPIRRIATGPAPVDQIRWFISISLPLVVWRMGGVPRNVGIDR